MEILKFWSCKDQLLFNDGIIYRGDRIVVPATLKKILTEKLHQAHVGVESTLRRARTSLWWVGMNSQLKQIISPCQVCQSFQRNIPKESLMSRSIPDRPWSKIVADLLSLRTFALIVSAHPYCARKFTCHVMHRALALSTKINSDRADGHCYSFPWI